MSDSRIWRKCVGVLRSTAEKKKKAALNSACWISHKHQLSPFTCTAVLLFSWTSRNNSGLAVQELLLYFIFIYFSVFDVLKKHAFGSIFLIATKILSFFFFRPQIFSPVLWAAAWMFKRLIIDEAKLKVRYQATQEMVEADTTAAASLQHRGFVLSQSSDVPVDDGRLKYLYPLHSRVHIWSRWRRTHWQGRTSRWVLKS